MMCMPNTISHQTQPMSQLQHMPTRWQHQQRVEQLRMHLLQVCTVGYQLQASLICTQVSLIMDCCAQQQGNFSIPSQPSVLATFHLLSQPACMIPSSQELSVTRLWSSSQSPHSLSSESVPLSVVAQ